MSSMSPETAPEDCLGGVEERKIEVQENHAHMKEKRRDSGFCIRRTSKKMNFREVCKKGCITLLNK